MERSATLRRQGDVWEIAFAGRSVSIRAAKGLAALAVLLAEPGREVHCLDLIGAVAAESSTGEALDAVARRQYEQRLRAVLRHLTDVRPELGRHLRHAIRTGAWCSYAPEHLVRSIS